MGYCYTFALALFLISGPALSEEDEPGTLLLITSPEAHEQMEQLQSVLSAYLSDFNVPVELRINTQVSGDVQSQVAAARQIAADENVLSIIWLERSSMEFFIFVADASSEKVLVQTLPNGSEGWDAKCDSIATLIRSTLIPWLESHTSPVLETQFAAPSPSPVPLAIEVAPPSVPPTPDEPVIDVLASISYSPVVLDGRGEKWTHGAELGIGLLIITHVEVDLSVMFMQSTKMDMSERDVSLSRWPIKTTVAAVLPINIVELGVRTGVVFDITRVKGISVQLAQDKTELVTVGFAPSVFARVRPLSWLGIWAEGGVFFFGENRQYVWEDETVMTYRAVQPRLSLGVSIIMPFRN